MARSVAEASILHQVSVNCLTNTLFYYCSEKVFKLPIRVVEDLKVSIAYEKALSNDSGFSPIKYSIKRSF